MKRSQLFQWLGFFFAWPAVAVAQKLQRATLQVNHSPNPCPLNKVRHGKKLRRPNVWYYRTEVRNNGKVPLQIIQFEGYTLENGRWIASNVTGKPLTKKEFAQWFAEGAPVPDAWIEPGAVAVCDPNFCFWDSPQGQKAKWKYTARDKQGKIYHAEAAIHLLSLEETKRYTG